MANFFKKLFYTPNYLALPSAGIAIYNRSIKYVEFHNQKGVISIKSFGEIPLAPNIIKDGEVLNKDGFGKALTQVRNKISSDFVRVSVPEEKTYLFDIKIPNMKTSQIRQALEFKLEENVPLKADEVFFEYELIVNKKQSIAPTADTSILVSVSVIPKKIITNLLDVFTASGITPVAFEIESRMTARSVVAKRDHRTFMIIDVKDESTVMSLVADNITRFSSTIAIGDANLIENLPKGEDTTKKSSPSISDSDVSASLVGVFSVMKDEVEKFNNYIMSKSQNENIMLPQAIDKIILCGKSASLPGLANHISQNIDAEVVPANVWTNILDIDDSLPAIRFEDSLAYVTSIGLAMPNNK
jgi:type IV pilus assembly protein PilM